MPNKPFLLTNNEKGIRPEIRTVQINDFFQSRYGCYDIIGEFLIEENDVVIGYDVEQKLFAETDAVGKKIKINDGNGYSVDLIVRGVNRTMNASGNYLTFLSSNIVKNLVEKQYTNENVCVVNKSYKIFFQHSSFTNGAI